MKIITYANAIKGHKHQNRKIKNKMQKKFLKKFCGGVVNRPARPLGGGVPPLAALAYFKAV